MKNSVKVILEQALEFLNECPEELYTKESNVVPKSTIGKHIRHTIKHFDKLFQLDILDYDQRKREATIETDKSEAIRYIKESILLPLLELLDRIKSPDFNQQRKVQVRLMDGQFKSFDSTIDREIWFCCHHAIHHYALIKAISIENNFFPSEKFGLAPSTIYHD